MKISRTKPRVKSMNISFYDLYSPAFKNFTEVDKNEISDESFQAFYP